MNELFLASPPPPAKKTAVLCHFENTGQTVIDDCGNTITARGTLNYITGKVGTNALYAVTPSTGIRIPAGAFNPGDGDFTIETWHSYHDKQTIVFSDFEGSVINTGIRFSNTRDLSVRIAGVAVPLTNPAISPTGWHHIAIVRQGGIVKVFIDGVLRNTGISAPGALPLQTWFYGYAINGAYGAFDEFRLSHVARYTANFTPSVSPFVAD